MWRTGQKLIHPYNPELGTGLVQAVEGRFLTVWFPAVTVDDGLVVELFDKTADEKRQDLYDKVLRTGSYAYLEDRIGTFLGTTATTIGAEFEHLKLLFDRHQQSMVTAEKGAIGEDAVVSALEVVVDNRGWDDVITETGGVGGALDGVNKNVNKTGDVVAHIGGPDSGPDSCGPCSSPGKETDPDLISICLLFRRRQDTRQEESTK